MAMWGNQKGHHDFRVREILGIMPPICKQPAIFNSFSLP
jgi:hypothetical protein